MDNVLDLKLAFIEKYFCTKEVELEAAIQELLSSVRWCQLDGYEPGRRFRVYFPRTNATAIVSIVETPTGLGYEIYPQNVWVYYSGEGIVVENEKEMIQEIERLYTIL